MKRITIELNRDTSPDGASSAQATEIRYSLFISAEQVSTPADFERLKAVITNAGLLFNKELED